MLAIAVGDRDGVRISEAELVEFNALATAEEDSLIEVDSVAEVLPGCVTWEVVVNSVGFV